MGPKLLMLGNSPLPSEADMRPFLSLSLSLSFSLFIPASRDRAALMTALSRYTDVRTS